MRCKKIRGYHDRLLVVLYDTLALLFTARVSRAVSSSPKLSRELTYVFFFFFFFLGGGGGTKKESFLFLL